MVGVVAGIFLGGLNFVFPPTSLEVGIVPFVVLLAVTGFVQWRWGDDIKKWLSGDDQP